MRKRNESFFLANESTRGLHRVEDGTVTLARYTAAGDKLIVHRACAGELFAEASVFADYYHCDAIAESTAVVTRFDKAYVTNALLSDSRMAFEFLSRYAHQVQTLRQRVELLSVRSAKERVRLHLAGIADREGALPSGTSVKALASEIALTPEAYSRALSALEKERYIRRDGKRQIVVLDKPIN